MTKTEICCQDELRFNIIYSRNDLPRNVNDKAYVIRLDEYIKIETHWVSWYFENNDATYFNSFVLILLYKRLKKL